MVECQCGASFNLESITWKGLKYKKLSEYRKRLIRRKIASQKQTLKFDQEGKTFLVFSSRTEEAAHMDKEDARSLKVERNLVAEPSNEYGREFPALGPGNVSDARKQAAGSRTPSWGETSSEFSEHLSNGQSEWGSLPSRCSDLDILCGMSDLTRLSSSTGKGIRQRQRRQERREGAHNVDVSALMLANVRLSL
jgi:hypothetical protein